MSVLKWLQQRWRLLVVVLIPLIFLPIPIVLKSPEARCGYIVLIVSAYWVSEAIPLSVTSLLPLFLFPMAGVLKAEIVAPYYFRDTVALFFGSLALAYAIEFVNLHRRIALFVLKYVGTSEKWAMAGLMGVTAFLSMWISNTASTSIMLSVAMAIIGELETHRKASSTNPELKKQVTIVDNKAFDSTDNEESFINVTSKVIHDNQIIEMSNPTIPVTVKTRSKLLCCVREEVTSSDSHEQYYNNLKKGFLLSVAYSSSIGGLSSLVGTGPNVYLKAFVDDKYKNTDFRVNFVNFLLFALPVGFIMLIVCWIWLQLVYNRKQFFQFRVDAETREIRTHLKTMLTQQYKNLGSPKWSEITVAIVFGLEVLFLITREFPDTPGWNIIFQHEYISDGTVAMFFGVLPLILPNSNPFNTQNSWKYIPIVKWSDLSKNMSWGVVFLLGGGLAIAKAFTESNLSDRVADAFSFISGAPRAAVIMIIIVVSGLFTEVTSNLSTATIFFNVLNSVAYSSRIHPAFLILPCTLAVSLAFMLPIATPPNAIVFASGTIRVIDMIKTGAVLNLFGFLVIFLACNTWMPKIFDVNDQSTALLFNITSITDGRIDYNSIHLIQ